MTPDAVCGALYPGGRGVSCMRSPHVDGAHVAVGGYRWERGIAGYLASSANSPGPLEEPAPDAEALAQALEIALDLAVELVAAAPAARPVPCANGQTYSRDEAMTRLAGAVRTLRAYTGG